MIRTTVAAVTAALALALLWGTAGASGAPAPAAASAERRAVPAAPNDHTFKVVSRRTYKEAGVGFWIYADLKNRTKKWRTKVRGTVTFYNRAGRRIARYPAYTEQLFAGPKARMTLKYYTPSLPKGYHHYSLAFTSKKAKKKQLPAKHLKVRVGKVALDPVKGGLNVPVTVKNRNRKKVRHVAVYVSLFDRKGRILTLRDGYTYTRPSTLRRGKVGRFTAYFGSQFDGVRRVRVQVEAKIKR